MMCYLQVVYHSYQHRLSLRTIPACPFDAKLEYYLKLVLGPTLEQEAGILGFTPALVEVGPLGGF